MTDGVYNIDVDILGRIQDFLIAVADPEGVQGVPVEPPPPPPPETKLFHFHGDFRENQEKIAKNQVQITNRTPFCKFVPHIKKSWIRPWFTIICSIC